MARGLHALAQHRIVVPLSHHVAPPPQNHFKKRVVGFDGAFDAEVLHFLEDFDGLLDDAGAPVGVDEGDESVLGAGRVGVVQEDAARVVELVVAAEDLDDLESGVGGVGEEAGALDPAVEVERVVRGGSAVEDVVDERRVEVWDHGPDRVLETGGPGAVGHHSTDGEFEVVVVVAGASGKGLELRLG